MNSRTALQVKKSNSLVEAKYDLSVLEHQLVALAISHINLGTLSPEKRIIQISVGNLLRDSGLSTKSGYDRVRDAARSLQTRQIFIPRENGDWLVAGWVASCEYFNGKGCVELEFSSKILPFLQNLAEKFTSYNFKVISKLRKKYSFRLYELLKQYERIGTRVLHLNALREVLLLQDAYSDYGAFIRRIIRPALQEINASTDIHVSYDPIKEGRRVASLRFSIHSNSTKSTGRRDERKVERVIKDRSDQYVRNIGRAPSDEAVAHWREKAEKGEPVW